MSQDNIDREQLEKDAIRDAATQDMKQHADKLIHGFEGDDQTHPRRAIWELVQNARDLSENCEIEIRYTENYFSFTHNGKPFTAMTLLSLIKQVSSKSDEKLNKEFTEGKEEAEIGQYGTGFITTHAFGKQFVLNGSIEIKEGMYISLDEFKIDRKARSSSQLAGMLVDQQNAIFSLLKETGKFTSEKKLTTFRYEFEDKLEKDNASDALELFTEHYVPIVMALNGRIKSIRIVNEVKHHEIFFEKGDAYDESGVTVLPIKIDGEPGKRIYYIQEKESEITVVLPLTERFKAKKWEKDTSRLFLYFPLIGTEEWGSNFIIHSGKFSPTEKRDGLHLKSTKTQTREKEENNRKLLEKASSLIYKFLKENDEKIGNPIELAPVYFDTQGENKLVNEYYNGLKKDWVTEFKELKLVETDAGLIAASEAIFYDPVFCNRPDFAVAIYDIAAMFWKNMPKKDISDEWTKIVAGWQDESISYITVDKIAGKIEAEITLGKFDQKNLLKFYQFLVSIESSAFEEHKLIPNIKKHFSEKLQLHTAEAIHPEFVGIADVIVTDIPKKFVLNSFSNIAELAPYSRKQLSKDWNGKFLETIKLIGEERLLTEEFRNALIRLCSTFPQLDKKGFRGELVEIISRYYAFTPVFVQIANIPDDEIEYETPVKCLLKNFLYEVYNRSRKEITWVEANLPFLHEILSLITGTGSAAYEDIIKTAPIFPDQNYDLKTQEQLQVEEDMPDGFKKFYEDVFSRDIKKDLILAESASYLPTLKAKSGSVLAVEINDYFEKNGPYTEILKHPNKDTINKIIRKITGKDGDPWKRLFPVISGIKETIMMSRVTNADVKDSMFNILDLEKEPKKIIALGDLAKDENMIRIIELGKVALASQQSDEADFDFKSNIGVHIEKLLLARIATEMKGKSIKVEPQSKQNGQDIIIKNGDDILYYIEIKSRWAGDVVTMSRNQITQAVKHPEDYALCVVNLVKFYPDDTSRHFPKDISHIEHLIQSVTNIGKQLAPLIENALEVDTDVNSVRLTGEYGATVPKKVYDDGLKFGPFIDFLAERLIKKLTDNNWVV